MTDQTQSSTIKHHIDSPQSADIPPKSSHTKSTVSDVATVAAVATIAAVAENTVNIFGYKLNITLFYFISCILVLVIGYYLYNFYFVTTTKRINNSCSNIPSSHSNTYDSYFIDDSQN